MQVKFIGIAALLLHRSEINLSRDSGAAY